MRPLPRIELFPTTSQHLLARTTAATSHPGLREQLVRPFWRRSRASEAGRLRALSSVIMVANDVRRKRRATAAAVPPQAARRVPSLAARDMAVRKTQRAGHKTAEAQGPAHPAGRGFVAPGDVPRFHENDGDEITPQDLSSAAGSAGPSTAAGGATLPGSPVSGGKERTPAVGGSVSKDWTSWLPSVSFLSHCWGFYLPRTRAVINEELVAQDVRRAGEAADVAAQVAAVILPKMEAIIESSGAAPQVSWQNRPVEEIRAATARAFPTKLVRKVYAKMLSSRVMALSVSLSASGDVITPLFPPACKLPTSDPFVVDNFTKILLSVLQGLYTAVKATGQVPDVLTGKGVVLSTMIDAVDEACLSQLRTFMNDGRAASRAFFYRFIGYYLMNVSPKVYIRLVHPTAAEPDAGEAEEADFFAVETCHVGSSTGLVSVLRPPGVPAPTASGPSGGTFTSVRSAGTGMGVLGWNQVLTRDIGTDSSFTSATGAYYPHVAGERLIKRRDCCYRMARGLVHHLLKGNIKLDAPVIKLVAMCLRQIISGPSISWTAADGGPLDHTEAIGPCKWWLLIPRLTTRAALDVKVQTLTTEEQAAHSIGHAAIPVVSNKTLDAAKDTDEAEADEGVAALDGGSDLELDG